MSRSLACPGSGDGALFPVSHRGPFPAAFSFEAAQALLDPPLESGLGFLASFQAALPDSLISVWAQPCPFFLFEFGDRHRQVGRLFGGASGGQLPGHSLGPCYTSPGLSERAVLEEWGALTLRV